MGKGIDQGGESKRPDKTRFKQASRRLKKGAGLANRAAVDWHHDSAQACDRSAPVYDIVPMEKLRAVLLKSRTAAALLENSYCARIELHYDRQIPASQYYNRDGRHIVTVNPYRAKGDLLGLLVRELRRAWQHEKGALVNPLSFEPDEAILVNRAQAADALMINIRVAWELKLVGEDDAWNFIAGSPMADVGRAFEIKAQNDFRSLNNGEAARTAYDKFFEDNRTRLHDKRIIHQMLLDESGYIKTQRQPARVSMELFKKLGEMPQGRNYLSMKTSRLPVDACYAAVEDRSNANFLWFIKFERSFQEKEAKMLEESVKLSAEIVDFAKWSMNRKQAQQTAN